MILPTAVAGDFLPKVRFSEALVRCGAQYRFRIRRLISIEYSRRHNERRFDHGKWPLSHR